MKQHKFTIIFTIFLLCAVLTGIADAGLGSPNLQVTGTVSPNSIERGGTGTLTVTVSEVGGGDYAYSLKIKPSFVSQTGCTISPSSASCQRIAEYGKVNYYFTISVPVTAPVSTVTGDIAVSYYETGWMDAGEYGPYSANGKFSFNIAKGSGSLSIASSPSGANVFIDGVLKGTAPISLNNIDEGQHTVKISKTGYEDYSTSCTVSVGRQTSLSPVLTPQTGIISISSSPLGATIFLDGTVKGLTPQMMYSVLPGYHTLRVSKDGYNDEEVSVFVSAGETVSRTVSLSEKTVVYSSPIYEGNTAKAAGESDSNQRINDIDVSLPPAPPLPYVDELQQGILAFVGVLIVGLLLLGGVLKMTGRKSDKKHPPSLSNRSADAARPTTKQTVTATIKGFPDQLLERYQPLEFIGEGGFAQVYKVKRRADGSIVALKIPRLDEKTSSTFMNEVATWHYLNDSQIVRLYKADILPVPYLEIEYMEGIIEGGKRVRDLDHIKKPMNEKGAAKVVYNIASGLRSAHEGGIIHNDLKPLNILLDTNGTPKIADFGLAKISARSTLTVQKGYSPLYAAPEDLDPALYGKPDCRTDLYQLGVIFFELLTGRMPYEGSSPGATLARVVAPDIMPPRVSSINATLVKYDDILARLLAKRKEDRFQTAIEFQEALKALLRLDREREELKESLEKTKVTLKMSTGSEEIQRLTRESVEKGAQVALLHAKLNDRPALIAAIEDLRVLSKSHAEELSQVIAQIEYMIGEDILPGSQFIESLEVLLSRIVKEMR